VQGRWTRQERRRNTRKTHLQLAFACEEGGGVRTALKGDKDPPPARFCVRGRRTRQERRRNAKKTHLRLAFACEEGRGAITVSKRDKDPPLARFCVRGRWSRREQCRNSINIHWGVFPPLSEYVAFVVRGMVLARSWRQDVEGVRRHLPVGFLHLWLSAGGSECLWFALRTSQVSPLVSYLLQTIRLSEIHRY
jgi:hypothetical protein